MRTIAQMKEHYEIERRLACRLMNTTKEERRILYASLYNELFKMVPHHPQLLKKKNKDKQDKAIRQQMSLLKNFLKPSSVFLEIGPGDCSFSFAVSKRVKKVVAVDVSYEIAKDKNQPDNFELIISDGTSVPVEPNSVDVAYSNQLFEHLHPDDSLEHLKQVYQALKPGGKYLCLTPNKLNGPHDISKYFCKEARGFHLREYSASDLVKLFKSVGYSKISLPKYARGFGFYLPVTAIIIFEYVYRKLPYKVKKKLGKLLIVNLILSINIIGVKEKRT